MALVAKSLRIGYEGQMCPLSMSVGRIPGEYSWCPRARRLKMTRLQGSAGGVLCCCACWRVVACHRIVATVIRPQHGLLLRYSQLHVRTDIQSTCSSCFGGGAGNLAWYADASSTRHVYLSDFRGLTGAARTMGLKSTAHAVYVPRLSCRVNRFDIIGPALSAQLAWLLCAGSSS